MIHLAWVLAAFALVSAPEVGWAQADETGRNRPDIIAAVPVLNPPDYSLDNAGRPQGFAIDVMDRIADAANLRVAYRTFDTWREAVDAVRSGQADLIPSLAIVPGRREDLDYSRPLATLPISLFVRVGNHDIGVIADLAGRSVAVVESNVAVDVLRARGGAYFRVFPTIDEALIRLLAGEVDAVAYPEPVLNHLARKSGLDEQIKVLRPPLVEFNQTVGVHKDRPGLVRELNVAIQSFVGSEEYRSLYVKWYGEPTPYWSATRIVWTMGSAVMIVSLLIFAWRFVSVQRFNRQLRAQVAQRDQAIAQRDRAQMVLAEREERFRVIIESSVDVISLIDDGGTILLQSPSVQAALGYVREDLVGRNMFDLIHPDDQMPTREALEKVLSDPGTTHSVRVRMRHKDESWHLMESSGRSLTGRAWHGKVVVNSRDITEQDLLAGQLRQAQKMESIGSLAGGIAHDFNNLLSIILSYGSFVLDQISEGDPARKDVEQILAAGNRAAVLTRQLLTFSRRQLVTLEVLDPNTVVIDVDKMLKRLIGEDVELVIRLAEGLHWVKADAGQLEQTVMNLAVNARDAMPTGGQLVIETANVTLDEEYAHKHPEVAPGDYVMLAVSDTGVGMDQATRKRIFEPFFTTKEQGKGTGLGLATVYGIVKQFEGSIWVYSELGIGTTFKIFLPVAEPSEERPPAPADADLPQGHETLLVVEDEDLVRAAACRMLREQGYTVLEASNGDDALQLCDQHGAGIDLLLTDVVMPKMSGRQLMERLSSVSPGLRNIYLSGYTDDAIVRHGVLEPNAVFVQKPFSKLFLLRAVRKVLDGTPEGKKAATEPA